MFRNCSVRVNKKFKFRFRSLSMSRLKCWDLRFCSHRRVVECSGLNTSVVEIFPLTYVGTRTLDVGSLLKLGEENSSCFLRCGQQTVAALREGFVGRCLDKWEILVMLMLSLSTNKLLLNYTKKLTVMLGFHQAVCFKSN